MIACFQVFEDKLYLFIYTPQGAPNDVSQELLEKQKQPKLQSSRQQGIIMVTAKPSAMKTLRMQETELVLYKQQRQDWQDVSAAKGILTQA